MTGLPATYEDRPIGPVHHLCRIRAAELLPASLARPRLWREGQHLCARDHGLSAFCFRFIGQFSGGSYLCLARKYHQERDPPCGPKHEEHAEQNIAYDA